MAAVGIAFIVILIGVLFWMLIDRSWLDDWMSPNKHCYSDSDGLEQAYIRMWPKPKTEFHDQEKEWPDVFGRGERILPTRGLSGS